MTIEAKIIAYSKSLKGQIIVTWELQYPRFIHSELLTHRLFSRNAASSRAIPVAAMIEQVRYRPAVPVHWGKNQPGMQASVELEGPAKWIVEGQWFAAAKNAAESAQAMSERGAHKQVANRVLEPFQTMKTVVTATCMDNFFWLRDHEDAQPEIKALARLMWEVLQDADPVLLFPGDWHTPYFRSGYWKPEFAAIGEETLEDALAISSSCCAQVSYRKLDDTLEKAQIVYKRLVESKPVHASPFEHSATPMQERKVGNMCPSVNLFEFPESWEKGITHVDRQGSFWSGNFIGFIQHRQLLDEHTCWDYKG